MVYYDFEMIQHIKRFIRKHKILFLFFIFFIVLSFKKIVFGADYTITQAQISKAESLLDSTYTRYSCHMYSNKKVIYTIGDESKGIWANDGLIQATDNQTVPWKCYWYYDATDTVQLFWSGTNFGHAAQDMTHMVANFNVYDSADKSGGYYYVYIPPVVYTHPSFITTASELNNIDNLEYLEIDQGSAEETCHLRLYNSTDNTLIFDRKLTYYEDYIERMDLDNPFSSLIYRIPINALPSFTVSSSKQYEFRLVYYDDSGVLSNVSVFFTPSVNQDVNNITNNDINNSIDKTNEQLTNLNENQQETNEKLDETNEKLDDLNDNITSSDVSSVSSSDLPSISVNDPTENGIGTIFQSMYNAFCTGNAQDIVFPIPFTNKSITLSPTYIQDMLHNHNGDWVLTFIQAFWAFIFGRFIILDMASKIMKIKSGNIENLQETNIKMEMM